MGWTPRWRSRVAGIQPSATEGGRWEIGVVCNYTFTLVDIGPVPMEWTKCALRFHHKRKPYGTEVAACDAGVANFKGRTLQFSEILSLDVSGGNLKKKILEVQLKCWSPVGLDVVQKTVALIELDLSSFAEAQSRVKGLILPMNIVEGMELKHKPILQVDITSTLADERVRVMERHGPALMSSTVSVCSPLSTPTQNRPQYCKAEPEGVGPVTQPRKPSVATPSTDAKDERASGETQSIPLEEWPQGGETARMGIEDKKGPLDSSLAPSCQMEQMDALDVGVESPAFGSGVKDFESGTLKIDNRQIVRTSETGRDRRLSGGPLRLCGGGWVKRNDGEPSIENIETKNGPPVGTPDGLAPISTKPPTRGRPVASPLKCSEAERGILFQALILRHQKSGNYLEKLQRRKGRSSREDKTPPAPRCTHAILLAPPISTEKRGCTGTSRDESWTTNPDYSSPKGRATKVSAMDSPVRTVERHLAEVGKRALHKGLFSCSDDIVQTVPGVRVTGEQGQIWSCNPMYKEDYFCTMFSPSSPSSSSSSSSTSSSDNSLSIVDSKRSTLERRSQSPVRSWSYDEDSLSLDDETDSDLDDNEENEINKIGVDFRPFGLTYQVHLEEKEESRDGTLKGKAEDENKSYEVSTIDTPRSIFHTPSEVGTRSAFSEFGVQTEDSWTREEDNDSEKKHRSPRSEENFMERAAGGKHGLDFEGSEFLCASAAELLDLRGIQDQIEHKDQEILELFQGLSNEFTGCSPGALEEVRMLREMVEQKELETSQLYSQISREMQSAMRAPPIPQENTIRNGCGVDFAVNERNVSGAAFEENFWDHEGASLESVCPSARNPPPQNASCTLPRPISRAEVPCPNPSSRLTKFMSGSSYYEAELDNAVSVTYGELNKRVQELEEDLRKKESEIAERDQVIQQLKLRKQDHSRGDIAACCKTENNNRSTTNAKAKTLGLTDTYDWSSFGKGTTTLVHYPKDGCCVSPRNEISGQDVENSCDPWGQGNPPWDSNRETEVQRCERKRLWSDSVCPGYKMFDKADKFEVDFPPIILKKTPALM